MTAAGRKLNQGRDFPGFGKILCHFCSLPLRDHPIEPCKTAGVDVFHTRTAVLSDRSQRMLEPCGTTASLRRHYRRKEKPCEPCLEAGRAYRNTLTANRKGDTGESG